MANTIAKYCTLLTHEGWNLYILVGTVLVATCHTRKPVHGLLD